MNTWAHGTIYGWQPEMGLFQSLLPAVFAGIPKLYMITGTLFESLLEIIFATPCGSLPDGASHHEE